MVLGTRGHLAVFFFVQTGDLFHGLTGTRQIEGRRRARGDGEGGKPSVMGKRGLGQKESGRWGKATLGLDFRTRNDRTKGLGRSDWAFGWSNQLKAVG